MRPCEFAGFWSFPQGYSHLWNYNRVVREGVVDDRPRRLRGYCQRVVSMKPVMISTKPINRFQLSIPGIGNLLWVM